LKIRARFVFAAAFAAVIPLGLAHIWLVVRGVHLKGLPIDFGDPPTRYQLAYGDSMQDFPAWRPGTTYLLRRDYDTEEEADAASNRQEREVAHHEKKIQNRYLRAERLEQQRKYRAALDIWSECLRRKIGETYVSRKRVDLLKVLVDHPGASGAGRLLLATQPTKSLATLPAEAEVAPELRPFVRYERAGHIESDTEAAKLYISNATEFPGSAMAEPSLIMAARTLLAQEEEGPPPVPDEIQLAQTALDQLSANYSKSRFGFDAYGLRARIAYLRRDYVTALHMYRHQLDVSPEEVGLHRPLESIFKCEQQLGRRANIAIAYLRWYGSSDERQKCYGTFRLQLMFPDFTAADSLAFRQAIRQDPKLFCAYLDYRLQDGEKRSEVVKLANSDGGKVLRSPYRNHFLATRAQAELLTFKYVSAARDARRALALGARGNDGAMSEYILGSIERRKGDTSGAIRHYQAILKDNPKSYLCGGAKESLALLYEKQGRWGDALDIYQDLKYDYDVAYMLDIRLSPSQIADYIASRPHLKARKMFVYSLGMRYLRAHQWKAAQSRFEQLTKTERARFSDAKDAYMYDQPTIQDPLKTAKDLASLDRAVASATGPTGKGKAMLAMASYYYENRDLLLYNSKLWGGERATSIGNSWNVEVATKDDEKALTDHHWEHECLAQTLLICRKIVKEFPKTNVRYQAAYLGACAAEHLSGFNPYWRWLNETDRLDSEAIRLMRIARRSPERKLAKKARKYAQVFFMDEKNDHDYGSGHHTLRWRNETW
jgi:lipopolysaccharide biosynthesis regulator YciM